MELSDLGVYRRAMKLGDTIWSEVEEWPSFARYTIGQQLVQAADSVAANISEGHGRYHYGENRKFCYYARGSLQEATTWLKKAQNRNLLPEARCNEISTDLVEVRKMLNGYIRSIGKNPKS